MILALILFCLVISTWMVSVSLPFCFISPFTATICYCVFYEDGTNKCMLENINTFLTELNLSWLPLSRLSVSAVLSDTQPEWTWHHHLTATKWAMSNDRGHRAHWLIVLNNEPGSPLWLVLEVGRLAAGRPFHSIQLRATEMDLSDDCWGGRIRTSIFHPSTAPYAVC